MNVTKAEGFSSEQVPSEASKGIADQAIAAGRDIQGAAQSFADASVSAIKDHASEFIDSAKGIAADAGDRLQRTMADQKSVGADYVGNLAQSMRRAAGEFDADVPLAATYIRKAADQVTNAAEALRDGNLNDVVQRVQSFARNQPTAFLGLAVLAGFGAVRFLKSASVDGANAPSPPLQRDDNLGGV
jgi:hypothetical protein